MFKKIHLIIKNSGYMNYFIRNKIKDNMPINMVLPIPFAYSVDGEHQFCSIVNANSDP